jgi:outer membrane murein-binding lipoprotein Lpp
MCHEIAKLTLAAIAISLCLSSGCSPEKKLEKTVVSDREERAKAEKGQRTLAYWNKIDEAQKQAKLSGKDSASESTRKLRVLAKKIEDVPTLGVDLEAVELYLIHCKEIRKLADWLEWRNRFGAVFEMGKESFLEGFTIGKYRGPTNERFAKEGKAIHDGRQEWQHQQNLVRARLSERYGCEFPR